MPDRDDLPIKANAEVPGPHAARARRIAVRHTRVEDVPRLIELQRRTYATIPPWTEDKFLSQLEIFPQGQIVAEIAGRIVGGASSLIVRWDERIVISSACG